MGNSPKRTVMQALCGDDGLPTTWFYQAGNGGTLALHLQRIPRLAQADLQGRTEYRSNDAGALAAQFERDLGIAQQAVESRSATFILPQEAVVALLAYKGHSVAQDSVRLAYELTFGRLRALVSGEPPRWV